MNRTTTLLITLCLLLAPSTLRAAPCDPPVLTAITISEETAGFSVDAEYPVLCRAEASRTVRDFVSNTIFDFKKLEPDHDLSRFPHKYEMLSRYAVWPAPGGRYVSVKLEIMVYTGGAHPNHWPMTWVFDMADGSEVPFERLFPDSEAALAKVSAVCRDVLPQSLGNMYLPDMLDAGVAPMVDNFKRFVLTGEGVAFFFAPYQVAPYAAGEQVVTIPYAELGGLISPAIASEVTPE